MGTFLASSKTGIEEVHILHPIFQVGAVGSPQQQTEGTSFDPLRLQAMRMARRKTLQDTLHRGHPVDTKEEEPLDSSPKQASNLGLNQVKDLAIFLKTSNSSDDAIAQHMAVLRASPDAPPSKILCSSLRRAVSTMSGGFKDRLSRRPQEKILIVPSLQEVSRNPDTLSITPAHTPIQASWIDKTSKLCDFQSTYINQVDMSLHAGNKPLKTNGLKRMREFCNFVFSPSVKEDYVIIGGHSIWFRYFFKTFLPYQSDHVGKKKKLVNCGVVAMTLIKVIRPSGQPTYMIDPNTVDVVYGGFH